MLLRKNEEMLDRIYSLETYARGLEVSLSQKEDTARQLLLGILACRQAVLSPAPRPQSPRLQLGLSPKLFDSSQPANEDLEVIRTQDIPSQLLVQLLTFRRSVRWRANLVAVMISANGHLKEAVRRSEDISQSFLIELLTIRKDARALYAQTKTKARLAMIMVRKQLEEIQTMEAEHETTNKYLLIQALTHRSRLSRLVSSCKSSSPVPASPLSSVVLSPSVSFQSLTTQLEALRISEAQAHAEKDSLAKSLSDVLENLKLPNPCVVIREDEPIKELVLALVFTWKMLQRSPALAKVPTDNVNEDRNLRREQIRTLRPGIPFDSVRARAFKLGPPMNKSAIPIQDPPRHRCELFCYCGRTLLTAVGVSPIYNADTSVNFDPYLARCLTQITDSQPRFPPGIPLDPHIAQSSILSPNHQHVLGPLVANSYPNPIHGRRSTIMSRGGYTFEPYIEVGFRPDGQIRQESPSGHLGFLQPVGPHDHVIDIGQSVVRHIPPRPFSAS